VDKDTSILGVEAFLDEGVRGSKVLKQVLVFDIIHVDEEVLVGLEERALLVVAKDGDHVSDACLLHLLPSLEGKQPGGDGSQHAARIASRYP
jgi:hypothetical protein